jgi:RHS repeat-associated protein
VFGLKGISRSAGTTVYFLRNGQGDVTGLVNPSGAVVAAYYYDAFGNHLNTTNNTNNPYRYRGYIFDESSGLYYLKARFYDPELARFMQEDTYRGEQTDPLSLNLYTYCHNNPIKYWDPTGHNAVVHQAAKEAYALGLSGPEIHSYISAAVAAAEVGGAAARQAATEAYALGLSGPEISQYIGSAVNAAKVETFATVWSKSTTVWKTPENAVEMASAGSNQGKLERIVVSGGAFNANPNKDYQWEFIDTALNQLKKGWTWLVADIGWTDEQKALIKAAADDAGVTLHWFNSAEQLINYINTKDVNGVGNQRTDNPIAEVYVFSHGSQDKIMFGHNHEGAKDFELTTSMVNNRIDSNAFFRITKAGFYSCNAGNGTNNIAQAWANKSGGNVRAATGKTDYADINQPYTFKFTEIKWGIWRLSRGDYDKPGASYRLPKLGSNSSWKTFKPQ